MTSLDEGRVDLNIDSSKLILPYPCENFARKSVQRSSSHDNVREESLSSSVCIADDQMSTKDPTTQWLVSANN